MADSGSLINLGELSKPATVLIEKVCNAVGIIYEPTRIRRRAVAEAAAAKTSAVLKIELTELEQRAAHRWVHQEARKQENIETITAAAAATLGEDAKVQDLDEDWVAHFSKQCDTVSSKEMQSLWSKLLAGEATVPGAFSKRTVDFVASLDKKDADLFTTFCQFVWHLGEPMPLIYDLDSDVYASKGITFTSMKHLDALGLISFESLAGYSCTGFLKHTNVVYCGRPTHIEFPAEKENNLDAGKALFTSVGKELFQICGATCNEQFYNYVVKRWFANGLLLSSFSKQQ